MRRHWGLAILALLVFCTSGRAETQISLDIGWGNTYRMGAWTPIFITVTDDKNRQVIAELSSPQGGAYAMRIRQSFAIGPAPATYPMYIPLPQQFELEQVTLTLRDARSGKRVASTKLRDSFDQSAYGPTPDCAFAGTSFIGVSGELSSARQIKGHFQHPQIMTDFLSVTRLPEVAVGYEGLDLLILNSLQFTEISPDQERAIRQWVSGGGDLLLIPGPLPMPQRGTLMDILPCTFGENISIEVSVERLNNAGLPQRFSKLRGRQLLPTGDAEPVPLFGGARPDDIIGYRRNAGFGTVVVLPFDAATLFFNDTWKAIEFWRPVLEDLVKLPVQHEPTASGSNQAYYNNYNDVSSQRRSYDLNQTMNWLGDIPGAGAFGFGYLAFVLLAMMAIVGPIDWFVLRWLGRQPWTWATTSGWIALITVGAIYIGHVFKSGDLHYRSLRLLDQADGTVMADYNLIGIYSPRTTSYDLTFNPESWWEPAHDALNYYSRGGMLNELVSHQDYRGTRPTLLAINVWNLRFLESQTAGPMPPVMHADVRIESRPTGRHVVGSVTNLSQKPLSNLWFRAGTGVARLPEDVTIAAGATHQIDLGINDDDKTFQAWTQENIGNYWQRRWDPSAQNGQKPDYGTIEGLTVERSLRIEEILKRRPEVICVYAELSKPSAPAALDDPQALEQHTAFVRALVVTEQ